MVKKIRLRYFYLRKREQTLVIRNKYEIILELKIRGKIKMNYIYTIATDSEPCHTTPLTIGCDSLVDLSQIVWNHHKMAVHLPMTLRTDASFWFSGPLAFFRSIIIDGGWTYIIQVPSLSVGEDLPHNYPIYCLHLVRSLSVSHSF